LGALYFHQCCNHSEQKLQQLNTLNDIIYSPLFIDQQDYKVKEAFDDYINSELLLNNKTSKGPFRKFCNMLGYFFGDINNDVEKISTIYDIDNIDDDKLQYLANHIGFNLRGFSPSKWRQQLRNAVDIYKKSGTLASIQAAVDTLITNSIFDLSGKVVELHESYLPYLIWYTLATESPLLKNLQIWTASKAAEYGIKEHDQDNLESSIKLVVDAILLDLYKKCSNHFIFKGIEMPVCRFYEIDNFGATTSLYTVFNEPYEKPYTLIEVGSEYYEDLVKGSDKYELEDILNNATVLGPLGSGIYPFVYIFYPNGYSLVVPFFLPINQKRAIFPRFPLVSKPFPLRQRPSAFLGVQRHRGCSIPFSRSNLQIRNPQP